MPTRSKQLIPAATVLFLVLSACGIFSPRSAAPAVPTALDITAAPTHLVLPSPSLTASPPPIPTPTSTTSPSPSPTITATPPPATALRVVYVDSSRNLWVWDEGKKPVLLANTGDMDRVRLSQDGSRVAVTRTTDLVHSSLWVVNTDGSGGYQLMSEGQITTAGFVDGAYTILPYQMVWIPGTHILALSTRPIFTGLEYVLNRDLITFNTDTGKRSVIFKPGQGGLFFFSPDGSLMALVKPDRIELGNPDGSNLRSVLVDPRPNAKKSDFTFSSWPFWAKDSSHMLVSLPETFTDETQPIQVAIWDIPVDGSKARQVRSISITPRSNPIFSPDLKRVAFINPLPGGSPINYGELRIALIGASATTLHTSGQVNFETWSPDSTHFVFRQEQSGSAFMGDINATSKPLTDMPDAENIHWVNDNRVIFMNKNGQTWELRVGPPTGESTIFASFPVGKHSPTYDYTH